MAPIYANAAPVDLSDYEDLPRYRSALVYVLESRTMPPWNPTPGYTRMQQDLSLTRQEKALLMDWLAGGAPEGPVTEGHCRTPSMPRWDRRN